MHSFMNPMKLSSIEACFNPHGLRALVVDHNPTSLFLLTKILQSYHYQVTPCPRPREALSLIRDGQSKFDIIISGVDFSSDMNGLQFLEIIDHETDLPVVVVSADDRKKTIIECVKKGACAYIPKPARKEDIHLLWQHVARKEILRFRQKEEIDNVENMEPDSSNCGSSDGGPVRNDREEEQGKKPRLIWTDELHQIFLDAVEQLGLNNAFPKKVLELMNVPGLTRENVASHLQKYRLNLRKQSGHPISGSIGHKELFVTELQDPLQQDRYYMDPAGSKLVFSHSNLL